jgi:ABC-2 type transport system permease protein
VTTATRTAPPAAHRHSRASGSLATTGRVLAQLRHDPRTIALLLVVPSVLLALMSAIWTGTPAVFDRVGLVMLGVFPFVVMFLVTSIAMLRERTSGTLERLLTTPLSRVALLTGYGLAFGLVATLQAGVTTLVGFGLLGLDTAGPVGLVVLVAVVNALLGVALGLLASAFARSEFQAVQFMPVVVLPQFLLCGLLAPRAEMAGWLQAVSDVLPMTYAVEALEQVGANDSATGTMVVDIAVVAGAALLALGLASATLSRRTP